MPFYASPPKSGNPPSSPVHAPSDIDVEYKSLKKLQDQYLAKLEKASGLSRDEARQQLLEEAQKLFADELAKQVEQTRADYKARAADLAQDISVEAMLHGATEYTAEYTVYSVAPWSMASTIMSWAS